MAGGASRAPIPLFTQLARFIAVGVLSAIVDFGILLALQHVGVLYWLAKAISFVFGTTTAYLLNRRWTFEASGSRRQFAAVLGLYATTFAVQVGLYAVLVPWLRGLGWRPLLITAVAFVIAQGVATTVNFLVQRAVIFRR